MFQFKQIDSHVQNRLFSRINALNRDTTTYKPLQPRTLDSSASLDEMLTKSVWAKVTSAVYEHDEDGKVIKDKLVRLSSSFKN